MKKLLSIKNLYKNYNNQKETVCAVDNISFDVYENDFISLIGPSGCGKSTILSIIGRLDNKSYGNIIYKDKINISYMFQEDALFPWKTVLDNCLLPLKINNKLNNENRNYVINLLKKYGLYDFINSYPNELSGGMRQRVALIRTLASKPDILLLDEPFSSLDSQIKMQVSNDIYKIIKDEKKTAIMVTHDIGEAISMSNKIILLTNRPAKIKNTYNITLEGNLPNIKRTDKNFIDIYNTIRNDFNG